MNSQEIEPPPMSFVDPVPPPWRRPLAHPLATHTGDLGQSFGLASPACHRSAHNGYCNPRQPCRMSYTPSSKYICGVLDWQAFRTIIPLDPGTSKRKTCSPRSPPDKGTLRRISTLRAASEQEEVGTRAASRRGLVEAILSGAVRQLRARAKPLTRARHPARPSGVLLFRRASRPSR